MLAKELHFLSGFYPLSNFSAWAAVG